MPCRGCRGCRGGIGSADALWLSRLSGSAAAALLLYRLLYYFLPWAAASLYLAGKLVRTRRRTRRAASRTSSSVITPVRPRVGRISRCGNCMNTPFLTVPVPIDTVRGSIAGRGP